LIATSVRLVRNDAIRRGVSIKLRLTEKLPALKIDPVQIQQILLNLATNSMDAMLDSPGPRTLEICTGMQDAEAVIVSVKDSGPGLTDQVQEKMFEPFFTTKPHGTGMGLAICRSIVEAHDGRIWASKSDQGTVFQFSLKV
jgi:signal transduction histidine kinase